MRFLITGTGRCGTAWAASVLQASGIRCGHQAVFRHEHVLGRSRWDWGDLQGDSSFEAVPLLASLRQEIERVVVLVRDPLAVIRSYVELGVFGPGMATDYGDLHSVLMGYLPEVLEADTPIERAARFWWRWNEKAMQHSDRVLRLEDVRLRPSVLIEQVGGIPDLPELWEADHNPRTAYKQRRMEVRWEDVPTRTRAAVRTLAREVGYG